MHLSRQLRSLKCTDLVRDGSRVVGVFRGCGITWESHERRACDLHAIPIKFMLGCKFDEKLVIIVVLLMARVLVGGVCDHDDVHPLFSTKFYQAIFEKWLMGIAWRNRMGTGTAWESHWSRMGIEPAHGKSPRGISFVISRTVR